MLIDYSLQMALSDLHRKELLADAAEYRLARLASSFRRSRRGTTSPSDPPEPHVPVGGQGASASPDVAAGPRSAQRNIDPEGRFAVPR